MVKTIEVLIIGAGAAGLMAAVAAGKRKRQVMIFDHANKVGKKILMSGGGRCNFTNYYIAPDKYISHNPHFMKSALTRYTQWDFIELVNRHKIAFHEKAQGQLFCDNKSQDIVTMLLKECEQIKARISLNTKIHAIKKLSAQGFKVVSTQGTVHCQSLIIATGGLSIPTLGASAFAYKLAEQFGIKVWPTRAGLVPFTLTEKDKDFTKDLSGVSVHSQINSDKTFFEDDLLFTHRGLSGPAVLQLSSYWQNNQRITVNFLPQLCLETWLKQERTDNPHKQLTTVISRYLPKSLIETFVSSALLTKKMAELANKDIEQVNDILCKWLIKPNGTEGYRTAEVTLGGIDCHTLCSKTMAVKEISDLYFIGEAVDVSGWLGGYNFQWAWSSGWAAGSYA